MFTIDQYDTTGMLEEILAAGIKYKIEDDWDAEQRLNHIIHLYSSLIISTNWQDKQDISTRVYQARKFRGQVWKGNSSYGT